MAWSDQPWILNGAAVRISIVGFDDGLQKARTLDGAPVSAINPDLTSLVDITTAVPLRENAGIAFMGDTKGGSFDIPGDLAQKWLAMPLNPNGRPNSDVLRPWFNGLDITRRPHGRWIIDFGIALPCVDAALYEAPFAFVQQTVKPERDKNNRESYREKWWLHVEPRPALRTAIRDLTRFLGTGRVAKHRLFVWIESQTLPDSRVFAFARQDDYFFGVLHSRAHEVWSLRMASRHGVGNDPTYNTTTCFETFPLPWPPGPEAGRDPRRHAIADAAHALNYLREKWLNPPGAAAAELKKRTLTNL